MPANLMLVKLKPSKHSFLTGATEVGQNPDNYSEPTHTKPQQTHQSLLHLNIQLGCTTVGHVSACLPKTPQGCWLGMVGSTCFFPFLPQMKTMSSCQKALKTCVSFRRKKSQTYFLAVFTCCKTTHSEGILGAVGFFSSYIK